MDEDELITGNNIINKQMGGATNPIDLPTHDNYIMGEKDPNEIVLEILNKGISDIIVNIKHKLGHDYNNQIGTFPDSIGIEKNSQNLYNIKQNDVDFLQNKLLNKSFDIDINSNITTLDTPNNTDFNDSKPNKTAEDIQTRLNNCHILEMLYLIKHEEVMKTFAFTLNLFDKYKYSIKLLLFVLKYLVVKKKTPEQAAHHEEEEDNTKPCVDVKLPKTLIPNIQTLLADQAKVQEVITGMKQQLETNPLGGVNASGVPNVLNPAGGPGEFDLDRSLGNPSTPGGP